ncbi:tail fiber domain-containing protein [Pseudescherichia sp.]|uniref:tail fiber domain-containing protein n=1 Tax=Pseudescherichia sp. TaxID=2055881 RepID=UPI0028A79D4C|nr:tail fiber domain-containing protein [Pseudescherichia sp.]
MIYTTGTIAGSGNTLTGTGTNFTAVGSLIRNGCTVIVLTSPPQAFQITGVTSATQLAVSPVVNPAIPAGTRYAILLSDSLSVDGLALDIAETFGMYQRYMGGFADVMTGTGNVTITINGVAVTVPAQKSLAQKDASGGVPVAQGGTGSTTAAGARSNLGITDTQLNSVSGKTGGTISSPVSVTAAMNVISQSGSYGEWAFIYPSTLKKMAYAFCENFGDMVFATTGATVAGTEKYFAMRQNGNFTTQGNISCVSLTQTSDADKKDDIATITDARDKIRLLRGVTYILKDTGMPSAGVIAQELMQVLPEAIGSVFDDYDQYESVEEPYEVETFDENGEPITVTETRVVSRLKRPRDDTRRSYTVDYAAVTGLVLQTAVELDQAVTALEKNQRNMEAFLQTHGYNPDTDYTQPEHEPENQ